MKQFIEKLIERLREKSFYMQTNRNRQEKFIHTETATEIINQLAEEYKSKTQADKIRLMSDEELADFLEEFEACDVCKYYDKNRCTFENPCVHEFAGVMIYEWLKSPTTN